MKQIIELRDTERRDIITETSEISLTNLSQILRFKQNGKSAEAVCKIVREDGGIKYTEGNESSKVKVLDSRGDVTSITNQLFIYDMETTRFIQDVMIGAGIVTAIVLVDQIEVEPSNMRAAVVITVPSVIIVIKRELRSSNQLQNVRIELPSELQLLI